MSLLLGGLIRVAPFSHRVFFVLFCFLLPRGNNRGQHFDVTGIVGKVYSIIADADLVINARYATAFTTGLYIDPVTTDVHKMRPRGTWMNEIGVVSGGLSLTVFVDPRSQTEECSIKPQDCLKCGSVFVNGKEAVLIGGVDSKSDVVVVTGNTKSSSFVSLKGESVDMEINIVPPPQVKGERLHWLFFSLSLPSSFDKKDVGLWTLCRLGTRLESSTTISTCK